MSRRVLQALHHSTPPQPPLIAHRSFANFYQPLDFRRLDPQSNDSHSIVTARAESRTCTLAQRVIRRKKGSWDLRIGRLSFITRYS